MFLIMYTIPQKQQRKTTPKGLAGVCDLPVGTKVMVIVQGGGLPQNVVVSPNNQVIAVTLNRPVNPDRDNEPETGNRRNTPPDNTNPTPPMPFRRGRDFPMRKQRPPM